MTITELLARAKEIMGEATPDERWNSTVDSTPDGMFEYATGPWHNQTKGDTNDASNDAHAIVAMRALIEPLLEVASAADQYCNTYEVTFGLRGGLIGHDPTINTHGDMLGEVRKALAALERSEL